MRYVGWYSNRARGERAKKAALPAGATLSSPVEELATEFASRAKAAWARLIRKVYEVDPLECPKCKGPMRVIALIEDAGVIRRILEHLGLWAPLATERALMNSPRLSERSWRSGAKSLRMPESACNDATPDPGVPSVISFGLRPSVFGRERRLPILAESGP